MNTLQDMDNMGTEETIKERHARTHTQPLDTEQTPSPASTSSQHTPAQAATGPDHHGGRLHLLTWCPISASLFPAHLPTSLPGYLGSWPCPQLPPKGGGLSSLPAPALSSPSAPFITLEFPAAPHPQPRQPAAFWAPPCRLSPPQSSGPPTPPGAGLQALASSRERDLLPPLTKRDSPLFVAGAGGSLQSPAGSLHTWPPHQGRVGLDPGQLGLRH